MNPHILQLEDHERRIAALEAAPARRGKGSASSRSDSLPRHVGDAAEKLLMDSYNQLSFASDAREITATAIIEHARAHDSEGVMPADIRAVTVYALIVQSLGVKVLWSTQPPPRLMQKPGQER